MHTIDSLSCGPIDGTIRCKCGYSKYTVYPNAGWGRRSVGIRRLNGKTKKEYVRDKLVAYYITHVAREQRLTQVHG